MLEMIGDVRGQKLLDLCCASDAVQAFSWHNLGAVVTACDITPKAIEIASENAKKMGLSVDFVVDDMQMLREFDGDQFDIVFATYPCWIQNLNEACKNWFRVLKAGGKLLLNMGHPIADCIEVTNSGLEITRNYNQPNPEIAESFDGTGLSDRFGGWSVDLPTVCYTYRVSDVLNAIADAGFVIKKVHESYNLTSEDVKSEVRSSQQMKWLPTEFTVLAIRRD